MHKALSSAVMFAVAMSAFAMPATACASMRVASGSSHAIILQNHASKPTIKPRQLPPNPCKNKTACR
jgi:hypothetical protein